MSVWKFPCYVDDALEQASRVFDHEMLGEHPLLKLANINIKDVGNFPLPMAMTEGLLFDNIKGGKVTLEALYGKQKHTSDQVDSFLEMTKGLVEVNFGLGSVYRMAYRILQNLENITQTPLDSSFAAAITGADFIGNKGSYRGPKATQERVKKTSAQALKILSHLGSMKRYLLHVKSVMGNYRHNKKMSADRSFSKTVDEYGFPPHVCNLLRIFDQYLLGNLWFLTDDNFKTCTVLTKKDVDRVYQVCRGVLLFDLYIIYNYSENQNVKTYAKTVRDVFVGSLLKTSRANEVCRAWDVTFNFVLAQFANDVDKRAEDLQRRKMLDEHLDMVVDYGLVAAAAKKVPIKEALDVLAIHKCLPTPDFDYFSQMERQRKLYSVNNPIGDKDGPALIQRDMVCQYKYLMLRAYQKMHGHLPGVVRSDVAHQDWHGYYPTVKLSSMDYHFVEDLDLTGCFDFEEYGTDIMSLVKDSAIIPTELPHSGNELNKLKPEKKNMLLDVFSREEDIDISAVKFDVGSVDVKAEDKPEAKKPNGRMFFELDTEHRLKQSEYEKNIARYVKNMPGCAVGIARREMLMKMNLVTGTSPFAEIHRERPIFFSFDLEKFSPHYNGNIHRVFDAVNAELFNKPDLLTSYRIHQQGDIHYYKKAIHHIIPKPDADLEGMSCKFNTAIHATVMSLAVRKLLEAQLIEKGARLVTFVDDGLLRLDVPSDRFEERLRAITDLIDKTYKECGFVIAFDKTLISSHVNIFLHRIFYNGREITSGLKAFLKMDNYCENNYKGLSAELQMAESTARAALVAGCDGHLVYHMYQFLIMDSIYKSKRRSDTLSNNFLAWLFAPVSLGGFGVKTLLELTGSLEYDTQMGWFSVMKQLMVVAPSLIPEFGVIINQSVKPKTDVDRLHNPNTIKRKDPTLNAFRLNMAVFDAVLNGGRFRNRANVLGRVLVAYDPVAYEDLLRDMTAKGTKLFYDSTMLDRVTTIVEKFVKSRTISKIVGPKRARAINFKNQKEAENVISYALGKRDVFDKKH